MSHWIRLWDDMPNDPKWRVISRKSGRPISETVATFLHMMVNAAAGNQGQLVNWSDEDVAIAIDAKPEHVAAIREAMEGKVLRSGNLTGYEKRQPKQADSSTERVKRWRETMKQNGNVPCNAETGETRLDILDKIEKETKEKVSVTASVTSPLASPRPLERRARERKEKKAERGQPRKEGNGVIAANDEPQRERSEAEKEKVRDELRIFADELAAKTASESSMRNASRSMAKNREEPSPINKTKAVNTTPYCADKSELVESLSVEAVTAILAPRPSR